MASKDKLKELLNYSTSLSTETPTTLPTTNGTTSDRPKLDASMLDALMGPDDAQLMLASMEAIKNGSLSEEEHEVAFENLEALVEQIDNAKNLQNTRLWAPLLEELCDSRAGHRRGAASVIAVATQNNPVSQADFLRYESAGLERLIALFASGEEETSVKRKVLYALTCALRNCAPALRRFEALGGWKSLSEYLDEPRDLSMSRRIVFFLGTLYASNGEDGFEAVSRGVKTGFPPKLVSLLTHQQVIEDEDLAEKILYTLAQSLKFDSQVLNRELKDRLKSLADNVKERYGEEFYEGRELDGLL